jgi:hypothetical protein
MFKKRDKKRSFTVAELHREEDIDNNEVKEEPIVMEGPSHKR